MRIGILSDTHNQRARTAEAVQLLQNQGAEMLIHCGDLVDPDLISLCAVLPFYFVFGNNDQNDIAEIQRAIDLTSQGVCLQWGGEVELAGKRIAVTHGHRLSEYHRLIATQPDYLLTGHSHRADVWHEGRTRRINPGALHRAREYTVGLLNLADDELRFLPVNS